MNREEKRIVEGFRDWIDTNTERGVTTIPNSLCEKVYKLIVKKNPNIIEIPDNATNGDIAKKFLPYDSYEFTEHCVLCYTGNFLNTIFDLDWWNAPYKENKE